MIFLKQIKYLIKYFCPIEIDKKLCISVFIGVIGIFLTKGLLLRYKQ